MSISEVTKEGILKVTAKLDDMPPVYVSANSKPFNVSYLFVKYVRYNVGQWRIQEIRGVGFYDGDPDDGEPVHLDLLDRGMHPTWLRNFLVAHLPVG